MKNQIIAEIEKQHQHLNELAFQIFDNPELGDETVFASKLLAEELKAQGFEVEYGIGGLKTSYRATFKNGEGGPNIGLLGEYDALKNQGHACGHHMQSPAAIGAAVALKNVLGQTDMPFTITVYGTPAEESFGGKIVMADNGCFKELDVALATHAAANGGCVACCGMALWSYRVDFYGIKAHASGSPHKGRSASDAMLLAFNGIEFMREHVMDGTRMHYAIAENTSPANVVCDHAVASFTLRFPDDSYLPELDQRFRDIIKGACLMTGTTYEIKQHPAFAAGKSNLNLVELAKENYIYNGFPLYETFFRRSGGSSDVYNVATVVPTVNCYVRYNSGTSHSQQWVDAGKTEEAEACILNSAKVLASIAYDLITQPDRLAAIKKEFEEN